MALRPVDGAARHAAAADKPVNRDNMIIVLQKMIDGTILWLQTLLYLLLYDFAGYTRCQDAMLLILSERQHLISSGNVI